MDLKMQFALENRPIHFHINSTSVIRSFKQNKLSFSSIEINKPLSAPVQSASMFTVITIRVEDSVIKLDTNITDNIICMVINV